MRRYQPLFEDKEIEVGGLPVTFNPPKTENGVDEMVKRLLSGGTYEINKSGDTLPLSSATAEVKSLIGGLAGKFPKDFMEVMAKMDNRAPDVTIDGKYVILQDEEGNELLKKELGSIGQKGTALFNKFDK